MWRMRNSQRDLETKLPWWAQGTGLSLLLTMSSSPWLLTLRLLTQQRKICSLCNENFAYGLIFTSNSMKPLLIVVWDWSHRHLIYRHLALVANFNRLKIYPSKFCNYFHFLSQNLRVQYLKFRLEISSENSLSLMSYLYSKSKQKNKIVIGGEIIISREAIYLE